MPNEERDRKGYGTTNADKERDMAAKGGPTTTLGNPDNKHGISRPYNEDLQTQIAAKSNNKPSGNQQQEKQQNKQ